jgi:hypothetical protein
VELEEQYKQALQANIDKNYFGRNATQAIMYHFMMATNNPSALKIANEVIKPKYKI